MRPVKNKTQRGYASCRLRPGLRNRNLQPLSLLRTHPITLRPFPSMLGFNVPNFNSADFTTTFPFSRSYLEFRLQMWISNDRNSRCHERSATLTKGKQWHVRRELGDMRYRSMTDSGTTKHRTARGYSRSTGMIERPWGKRGRGYGVATMVRVQRLEFGS